MTSIVGCAEEVLSKLENIEQMPSAHNERLALLKGVVLVGQANDGDLGQFITSITQINNDCLYKSLVILEKYDEFALSIATSRVLPAVFNLVERQLKSNNKVLSVLLEFFLKGTEPSIISSVSKDNIVAISAFANRCISHTELEVANVASKLNEKLIGLYPHELIANTSSFIQTCSHSTIQLRYVSLLNHQASISSELFLQCAAFGVIDTVVRLCQEPDILMQINALDFLPPLASTQAGLDYLCDHHVVNWLISVACEESSASFDPVLCTEALRVLGAVFNKASSLSYDLTVKLPANHVKLFLNTVLMYLEDRNESHKVAAVGMLCDFAKVSLNTLRLVVDHKRLLGEWVGLLKSSSKPEMSGAVLHSIARVLYQEDSSYVGVDSVSSSSVGSVLTSVENVAAESEESRRQSVLRLKKQLLLAIDEAKGVHYPVYLLKMATSPITPVRYAALDVMAAMASQPSGWGLLILSQTQSPSHEGGFVGYLANRETEFCKEGKEWKYSLIKAIHLNPARQMLNETFNKSVDLLVSQGPFYMPPRMAELMTV